MVGITLAVLSAQANFTVIPYYSLWALPVIALDTAGKEGFELGAERDAEAVAERGGVFSEEEAWDALAEIPEDTAGQLEHRWAIPLRRKARRVARRSLRRTTPTIEEPD